MNEQKIINFLEKKNIKINKNINYNLKVGDNISLYYSSKIIDSNYEVITKKKGLGIKSKDHIFTGNIISIKGNNKFNKTFIIRKNINNIGVEITFNLYSHNIKKIIINNKGKVKKSKLYYIRKYKNKKIKFNKK